MTPRPSVPLPATTSDGQPAIPKTTDNAATMKYVAVALLLGFLIVCVIVAFAFTNKTKIDPSTSSNNTLPELPAGVVGYYSNKDSDKNKCTIYKAFRKYYDTSSCRPKWMANITSDGTLSDVPSGTHYRTEADGDARSGSWDLTRDLYFLVADGNIEEDEIDSSLTLHLAVCDTVDEDDGSYTGCHELDFRGTDINDYNLHVLSITPREIIIASDANGTIYRYNAEQS